MKTRFGIIVLLLIVLGTGFQGCRSTLALLTKNAKRTIVNTNNERYELVVKINYSTGNQQPIFELNPERVVVVNGTLATVIQRLKEQPSTRVVFQKKQQGKKTKLDIAFRYKAPFSQNAPYDTLLQRLSERLDFLLVNDSVANLSQ